MHTSYTFTHSNLLTNNLLHRLISLLSLLPFPQVALIDSDGVQNYRNRCQRRYPSTLRTSCLQQAGFSLSHPIVVTGAPPRNSRAPHNDPTTRLINSVAAQHTHQRWSIQPSYIASAPSLHLSAPPSAPTHSSHRRPSMYPNSYIAHHIPPLDDRQW